MAAACFNLHSKAWKVIETRVYLKQIGISTVMTDKLIDHATDKQYQTKSRNDVFKELTCSGHEIISTKMIQI